MDGMFTTQSFIALVTLTALEIVLGIDNIVFISILASRLPSRQKDRARVIGLALAMFSRIGLLLSLTWIMRLTRPLFSLLGHAFSGRDLILLGGGLFLLMKSTFEIHESLEGPREKEKSRASRTFFLVVVQIMVLDIIFSLDSVITAVGLARELWVMILAIVLAVAVMMLSVAAISRFVERHPTIRMLALAFLILIGVTLIAEGLAFHIPKGYVYFAMAFSVFVEFLNHKLRQKREEPVVLRKAIS